MSGPKDCVQTRDDLGFVTSASMNRYQHRWELPSSIVLLKLNNLPMCGFRKVLCRCRPLSSKHKEGVLQAQYALFV
jgi:hypothetical protein